MKRLALIALLGLLGAAPALAEVQFSAGPTIGGTNVGGNMEPREVLYGGQGTVHFNHGWSLELAILHFRDEPVEERFGISVTTEQDLTPMMLSVRYTHSLGEWLDGYVLTGIAYFPDEQSSFEIQNADIGGYLTQTGPLVADRDEAFGYQIGAGLVKGLTDRLFVRLEYRLAIMDSDAHLSGLVANTPEGQVAVDAFEKDFWDNDELGYISIGLDWYF